LRLSRPELDFLSPTARGPQRRSRTIRKSTQLTQEIVDIEASSPRIGRRRGISSALITQRSGARSIAP
jgi:hypothetical protein